MWLQVPRLKNMKNCIPDERRLGYFSSLGLTPHDAPSFRPLDNELHPHEHRFAETIKRIAFHSYLKSFPNGTLNDEFAPTTPLCVIKHFLGTVSLNIFTPTLLF